MERLRRTEEKRTKSQDDKGLLLTYYCHPFTHKGFIYAAVSQVSN